ncbi:MAG: hypothetical protein GY909_00650 [Oligoflexia bacterium]|nr:hypothetical protein [Oligoflexia bacterium]
MKNVERLLLLILTISLVSCSGGNSEKGANSDTPIVKGSITTNEAVELETMNEALNSSEGYELKLSEIDELKSKGLITDKEYAQLLTLVNQ